MLEKFTDAVFAYCFAMLNLFDAFIERTPDPLAVGLPALFMVGVHYYLPIWVEAGILALVFAPAGAAMITMLVHGLLLTQRR